MLKNRKLLYLSLTTLLFVNVIFADVFNLQNGDKITGKLISQTDKNYVVETDLFGQINLDKQNVKSFVNANEQKVEAEKVEEQKVAEENTKQENKKEELDAQDQFVKDCYDSWIAFTEKYIPDPWKGKISTGLMYKNSSSESFTFNTAFELNRKTETNELSFFGFYNYTHEDYDGGIQANTTDKYGAGVNYQRNFRKWFILSQSEYRVDMVKNIKNQATETITGGYTFLDNDQWLVKVSAGPALRYVNAEGLDQRWFPLAVVDETVRWKFSKYFSLEQNGYYGLDMTDFGRYTMNFNLGLVCTLENFNIALRYNNNYDSINATDATSQDETFVLSFEVPF